MKYFWYYDPDTTPAPIVYPNELGTSDRLNIACTQTRLPSREQKALVNEWCNLLPSLTGVRLLWLSSKVPQVLFDAVCRMPQLEGLWIKWSGVTSIEGIEALTRLAYFHLGSSTQVTSIQPLSGRTGLLWLGLENLAKIDRLDPLAGLTNLEGLALEGSMWKTWTVATLSPISRLRGLRYLSLANLRAVDHTLTPLFTLRQLETLNIAKWWPDAEVAELRRRNPMLET
jgi:hypothetical protein